MSEYNLFKNDYLKLVQVTVAEIQSGNEKAVAEIQSGNEKAVAEIQSDINFVSKIMELLSEHKGEGEDIKAKLKEMLLRGTSKERDEFRTRTTQLQRERNPIYSIMQSVQSQSDTELKRRVARERVADITKKQVEIVSKETSFANKVGNNHKFNVVKCPVASQVRTAISPAHPYKVKYNIHPTGRDGLFQEQDVVNQVLELNFVTEREETSCTTQLPYLDQTSIRFEDENLHRWYVIRFSKTAVKGIAKLICSKR